MIQRVTFWQCSLFSTCWCFWSMDPKRDSISSFPEGCLWFALPWTDSWSDCTGWWRRWGSFCWGLIQVRLKSTLLSLSPIQGNACFGSRCRFGISCIPRLSLKITSPGNRCFKSLSSKLSASAKSGHQDRSPDVTAKTTSSWWTLPLRCGPMDSSWAQSKTNWNTPIGMFNYSDSNHNQTTKSFLHFCLRVVSLACW